MIEEVQLCNCGPMRRRHELSHRFSTFLSFQDERKQVWVADSRLRRSLKQVQANQGFPVAMDDPWYLHWHQVWSTDPLAFAHLNAYLQEACFWAAQKMSRHLVARMSLADLFQGAIVRTRRVLKGFNPAVSSNLHSYGEYCFTNLIKDQLRQCREIDACTPWGLLHRVSRKGLREALTRSGVTGDLQAQYLLAWSCYRELYAPAKDGLRKLPKPTVSDWEAIAQAYNQQRLSILNRAGAKATAEDVEQWALASVKAVRSFKRPMTVSADAPLGGDDGGGSYYDVLPGDSESLLDEMVDQETQEERKGQQMELSEVLAGAIAQLKPEEQSLLQLYYGEQRRQQEIAVALGVKQYSISRKLTRVRRQLLAALLTWSQETLHIVLDPSVVDSMGSSLEDWLLSRYRPES